MKAMKNVAAAFALSLAMSAGSLSSAAPSESYLLAATTAQWWQFALSIPTSVNPIVGSGDNCVVGQRGPIWFLAGSFFGGMAQRTCHIPSGEWLFFPVINTVQINSPGVCGQTGSVNVADLRSAAAGFIDSATSMSVTLDDRPLKNLVRVKSEVFATSFPIDNIFNPVCEPAGLGKVPAGVYSPSVDDGYYVLLKPLKIGTHTLSIQAESVGFSQYVTYTLIIDRVDLN